MWSAVQYATTRHYSACTAVPTAREDDSDSRCTPWYGVYCWYCTAVTTGAFLLGGHLCTGEQTLLASYSTTYTYIVTLLAHVGVQRVVLENSYTDLH
jgi:hypothetical protein